MLFFCFKKSSYDLFESYYNTNLILPLPLNIPEIFLKEKLNAYINSVASMEATPLFPPLIKLTTTE